MVDLSAKKGNSIVVSMTVYEAKEAIGKDNLSDN
jgi:hypothetical protein